MSNGGGFDPDRRADYRLRVLFDLIKEFTSAHNLGIPDDDIRAFLRSTQVKGTIL